MAPNIGMPTESPTSVTWVIHGIEREAMGQQRDELLKNVELGSKRVEKHERWPDTNPDIAQAKAIDRDVLDGYGWRPGQPLRRLRLRSN